MEFGGFATAESLERCVNVGQQFSRPHYYLDIVKYVQIRESLDFHKNNLLGKLSDIKM